MLRVDKAAVAMSVQDRGRFGHRAEGLTTSGAMDFPCLLAGNRLLGNSEDEAGIEIGPSPCVITALEATEVSLTGAVRGGASFWSVLALDQFTSMRLSSPIDGTWSYLCIKGGVDAPVVGGSRATSVREGVGKWLCDGDLINTRGGVTTQPRAISPLPMSGAIRAFGDVEGIWTVGSRRDRMAYELVGQTKVLGRADECSDPVKAGAIQITPGGGAFVLMAEAPTIGGYSVAGVIHSEDLRLVAQARPGDELDLIPHGK